NPGLFFAPGGGPAADIGPYYLSALIGLLGRVDSVAAVQTRGEPTRQVTSDDRQVDSVQVQVDTHTAALFTFASGVVGTVTLSFEAWERTVPFIEIYGTEGTLSLPM